MKIKRAFFFFKSLNLFFYFPQSLWFSEAIARYVPNKEIKKNFYMPSLRCHVEAELGKTLFTIQLK